MNSDSVYINEVLELKFVADEFVWILNTKEFIIDSDSGLFYEELCSIMNNNYVFGNNICFKDNDRLVWLSDGYCDIEDEDSLSRVNSLIIEKRNDSFLIKIYNPFLEENNINRSFYLVCFSPLNNGYFSKNISSGLSLQDDFCLMYQRLLSTKRHVLK